MRLNRMVLLAGLFTLSGGLLSIAAAECPQPPQEKREAQRAALFAKADVEVRLASAPSFLSMSFHPPPLTLARFPLRSSSASIGRMPQSGHSSGHALVYDLLLQQKQKLVEYCTWVRLR